MKWIALFACLMVACTTAPSEEPELNAGAGRSFPIEIDATARENAAKSYRIVNENTPSLQEQENQQRLERALELAGFEKSETPELEIRLSSTVEKPFLGLPLGNLNAYTHRVKVEAIAAGSVLWEIRASGPSEHEDNRSVFPYLMLGSLSYFGKSSGGPKRINARDDDPRLGKMQQTPDTRKRGLLE